MIFISLWSYTFPNLLKFPHANSLQSCLTLCDLMDHCLGFSRQEYWSGLPRHSPGDLPEPQIEPIFFHLLHWQVSSLALALIVIISSGLLQRLWPKKIMYCPFNLSIGGLWSKRVKVFMQTLTVRGQHPWGMSYKCPATATTLCPLVYTHWHRASKCWGHLLCHVSPPDIQN